jgi:hypothetical protein
VGAYIKRMLRASFAAAVVALVSFVLMSAAGAAPVTGPGDYYVTADHVDERLGPSSKAKSTNTLFKRQKVTVFEVRSGWARVSKYYDGGAELMSGQVARWVAVKDLSSVRPADEKANGADPALFKALKDSDDFALYRVAFMGGSQKLIEAGTCKLRDFNDNGGWSKSTNHGGAVYFTYCGGNRRENRLYLDASTGRTFR